VGGDLLTALKLTVCYGEDASYKQPSILMGYTWKLRCDWSTIPNNMKKRSEPTQTLLAGCSKAEPRIFAAAQTPFTGAWDGQILISWRWSRGHLYLQTQFGEDRCTQFRVSVATDARTNTQTDRDDYNTLRRSLARTAIIMAISNPTTHRWRDSPVRPLWPAVRIYVIETRTECEKCAYTLRLSDNIGVGTGEPGAWAPWLFCLRVPICPWPTHFWKMPPHLWAKSNALFSELISF